MLQVGLLLLSCGLCQHVHKRLRRVYLHQPRSCILRCNRDYRHVIACVPISNASIYRSSRLMEEDPTRYPLLCCSLQTVFLWTHQMQNVQARRLKPWSKPKDLTIIRRTDTNDTRWASWIITDPEAPHAAIRLAGTIRWFGDRINGVDLHSRDVQIQVICKETVRTCILRGRSGLTYHPPPT